MDLLLSRYSNVEFVLNLPCGDFIKQILKAREKDNEEKDYKMWLSLLPNMGKENYISFDEFRNLGKKKQANEIRTNKSDEEIIQDVEKILQIRR